MHNFIVLDTVLSHCSHTILHFI